MSVRRAIRLTTLSAALTFFLSLTSVIVVSRLLSPEEIGIFGVAVSLIAYTHILREFGVGQYFVQVKQLTRAHLRAGFTMMLLISWSVALLLVLSRHAVATFYGNEGLAEVLGVLAFNFVILPFGSHILSLMKREMQFGRLAIVNVSNSVVQVSVTIAAAVAGESYMSMAWGSITGNITNVVMLSLMRPDFALLTPTSKGLREVFSFGWKASTNSLVGELGSSGPNIILGKTLGFEAVAIFGRADSLNNMVLGKVMDIVHQVFFPAFAKGIRDGRSPAAMYCESMRLVSGVTVPMISVLALLASPLVLFLFGPQWHESARLAVFLCLFELVRAPVAFAGHSLIAGGHVGTVMRVQFIVQAVRLGLLSLSIWLSLREVIYLLILSSVIEMLVLVRALNKHYGLSLVQLWSETLVSYKIVPITIIGPLMLLFLSAADWWTLPPTIYLGLSCVLACMGYFLGISIFNHPIRNELIHQLPVLTKLLR